MWNTTFSPLFQLHPYDNYQLMPHHQGVNSFLSQLQLPWTYFWVLESPDGASKPLTLKDHSQSPALGKVIHAPLQICNIWVILGTSQNPAVTLVRWNQPEDFYYGDYFTLNFLGDNFLIQCCLHRAWINCLLGLFRLEPELLQLYSE